MADHDPARRYKLRPDLPHDLLLVRLRGKPLESAEPRVPPAAVVLGPAIERGKHPATWAKQVVVTGVEVQRVAQGAHLDRTLCRSGRQHQQPFSLALGGLQHVAVQRVDSPAAVDFVENYLTDFRRKAELAVVVLPGLCLNAVNSLRVAVTGPVTGEVNCFEAVDALEITLPLFNAVLPLSEWGVTSTK